MEMKLSLRLMKVRNCDEKSVPTDGSYVILGTKNGLLKMLKMVHYRDGTPIPQVTDTTEWESLTTGAWSYYDNDPTKPRLYNWYAVMGIHDRRPIYS